MTTLAGDHDGPAPTLFRLVGSVGLCLLAGAVGSLITASEIPGWYAGLVKPSWTPPDWVFPVVWTTLYALMGVALWRLGDRAPPSVFRTRALAWFFIQLLLNAVWTPVFFGFHAIAAGLAIIFALFGAVVVTAVTAARVDSTAALLLLPYVLWVAYAASLNAGIAWLN